MGHGTCRCEWAWQRTVATATLLYLLVVLCSGFKNLHYLGPLLPIPIIFFLAPDGSRSQGTGAKGIGGIREFAGISWFLAACSLILCIVLCWP